ncbi:MAG TPA: hypothetical protein VN931_05080 [Fibrobacteria bacterium]|nr:hypothetical protein [Fibrobacteria bacterium]
MNWIELLLAAAALFLAAAAFRQSRAPRPEGDGAGEAALHQGLVLLRDAIDALPGRIADETAASPLREAVEAVRESITVLGESLEARTEATRAQNAASSAVMAESVKSAVAGLAAVVRDASEASSSTRSETRAALLAGVDRLAERTGALSERVHTGFESAAVPKTSLENVLSALETLPVRIAEASAAHRAPAPELEELAVAVRESGNLRGETERQVARAVAEVGRELSESADRARDDREAAAKALDAALERMEQVASGVRSALEPLEGLLASQGASVAPMVQALEATRDRLEEASGTQRANQVEFSATVEVFGRAAQELSTGLSRFAREGEMEGLLDPRQAQNALLEALERLLKGFSASLAALLSESDLRTRETLAELAARLPGTEGARLPGTEGTGRPGAGG